jgi:hypothetical protein
MGSGNAGNCAVRALRWHPEWITVALDNERRNLDVIELGKAALLGAARRVERERETQDGDRVGLVGGATRYPRAQRSTASQDWEATERAVP